MELISQRTTSAGMSSLEQLPVELFRQVTGYLAFFDKKAVQVTSKQCCSLTGHFICPDVLLWTLHCCRSGIPCHPNSSIMSDILELYALTLDYVRDDTWLDLSQGREARDAHLAFLEEWSSISFFGVSDEYRQHVLSSMDPDTAPRESRFALRHHIISNPYVLQPKWLFSTISPSVVVFEQWTFNTASAEATYEDEIRGISSFYISPILQPYIDKGFPMSSVAHFCLSVVDAKLTDLRSAGKISTMDVGRPFYLWESMRHVSPTVRQLEGEPHFQHQCDPNRLADRNWRDGCIPPKQRDVFRRSRRIFAEDTA